MSVTDDASVVHVLMFVTERSSPLWGAEIIMEMTVDLNKYPHAAPSVRCLSPCPIMMPNERLCFGIGEYHSDQWRPILGVPGFAKYIQQFVTTFFDIEGGFNNGIGLIPSASQSNCRHAAMMSYYANRNAQPFLSKMFTSTYHSALAQIAENFDVLMRESPDLPPVQALRQLRIDVNQQLADRSWAGRTEMIKYVKAYGLTLKACLRPVAATAASAATADTAASAAASAATSAATSAVASAVATTDAASGAAAAAATTDAAAEMETAMA